MPSSRKEAIAVNNLPEKSVKIADLFDLTVDYIAPLFDNLTYPWEALPMIKDYISKLISGGIPGFTELKPGVLVGENVNIANTATIGTNVIIGPNTDIGPGAFIRGNALIGPNCHIGTACELKNCVLMYHAQAPHYNYVGDSIMGNYAHMGAGAICSNLKQDGKNIVIHGDVNYDTGLRKIGGIIGDHAEIGCQSVLNPGTVIGRSSQVYPLTSVRGVIPSNCIVKSSENIIIKEAR